LSVCRFILNLTENNHCVGDSPSLEKPQLEKIARAIMNIQAAANAIPNAKIIINNFYLFYVFKCVIFLYILVLNLGKVNLKFHHKKADFID